jgi:peptidoglycan hydrolase-like protein with peptidoglycan-binding domain
MGFRVLGRGRRFRFDAGGTMLRNLPAILDRELQTADRRTSVPSEEKSYPVAARLVGIEPDKITTSGNQTLSSEKIRQEQSRLRGAGFDPGPIDGILGPKTKAAMQRYQKSLALKSSKQPSTRRLPSPYMARLRK